MADKKLRVLVAKPGLDGHDRGAKVVALMLRDAGFEVIYTGLHKSVDQIVETAIEEDVDVIGLSMLSGAHLSITKKLLGKLEEAGDKDKLVIVGGNIPNQDFSALQTMGIKGIFPTGSEFKEIVSFIHEQVGSLEAK